jgi:hypothetical protein
MTIAFFPRSLPLGSSAASRSSTIPWPSFTVGAGDRGYAAAMRKAHEGPLLDVRADLHATAVLGIWRRDCTEVHAAMPASLSDA